MTPEGWQKKTVGELCEFSNGKGFSANDWSESGLPIIRIQNLNGSSDFNYFSGDPLDKWIVEPGQLLFAWAGTKGVSFGPTIWNGPRGVLNQHIYRLTPIHEVDKRWLYPVLRRITDKVEAKAHGFKSTLVHVHKRDITDVVVPVPPEREQLAIAKILELWNSAIGVCTRLTESSLQQKKALAQQLLTGKRRLSGFRTNDELAQTSVGRLPADWDVVSIGKVAAEVSIRNADNKNLPVLACSKHVGFVNSLEYFKKKVFSDDLTNYKIIRHGQFGFPSNHIEEGSIGLQSLCDAGVVSPIYTVFEVDVSRVDPGFLYKVLKTDHYRQRFAAATNASVDRRGSLRWKGFKAIRIPLPSLREQQSISAVLDQAATLEHRYKQQREKLELEKRALMQQLLTGKRRVKLPPENVPKTVDPLS